MTTVIPPTKSKKDTRKNCTACRKKFQPTHQSIKTCSVECKRVRHNKGKKNTTQKKRQPKPLQMSNAFIQLLLRHAKQAGTVQIVQGITTEELLELRTMHKLQLRANSTSSSAFGDFQFSHVYPVKGQKRTGKFVPSNLVIASASLNRSLKNMHLGGGAFISLADKNVKWDILARMDDKDIMELMIECITRPVWDAFAKVAKLLPSVRQARLDTLGTLLDPTNPEHAEYLKAAANPKISTQDLGALIEAVTGEELFQVSGRCYVSRMVVLILETKRMSVYRPELVPVLKVLESVEQMASWITHDSYAISEFDEGLFFDILHGKAVTETTLKVLKGWSKATGIGLWRETRPQFGPAPIDSYTPEQLAEYRALTVSTVQRDSQVSSDFWEYVMEQKLAA